MAFIHLSLASLAYGQGTWIPRIGLGGEAGERWGTSEFVIDEVGYVVGGRSGSNDLTQVWAYSSATDNWQARAPIPGERRLASAFAINGKGYVTCGLYGTSSMRNDLWEYDPASNTWTQRASLPGQARYSASSFVLNGKGYVVGGNQGGATGPYTTQAWAYDPATDTWTAVAPFPGQAHFAARGFVAAGKGHVFGGRQADQTFSNLLWQYDAATNSWTERAPLPAIPRTYSYAWSYGEHGLIMGGDNLQGQQLTDLWRYEPASNNWLQFVSYAGGGLWGGASFVINGRIYAGMGRQGSGAVNDLWELRDAFVGMEEASALQVLHLGPNPVAAGASLVVVLPPAVSMVSTQLVFRNLLGQEVHSQLVQGSGPLVVQLPALAAGTYVAALVGMQGPMAQARLVVAE